MTYRLPFSHPSFLLTYILMDKYKLHYHWSQEQTNITPQFSAKCTFLVIPSFEIISMSNTHYIELVWNKTQEIDSLVQIKHTQLQPINGNKLARLWLEDKLILYVNTFQSHKVTLCQRERRDSQTCTQLISFVVHVELIYSAIYETVILHDRAKSPVKAQRKVKNRISSKIISIWTEFPVYPNIYFRKVYSTVKIFYYLCTQSLLPHRTAYYILLYYCFFTPRVQPWHCSYALLK